MSRVLHDIRCAKCQRLMPDVLVDTENMPKCRCGGATRWVPSRMNTDLYPTPRYSDATGKTHTSQREKERYMRDRGFTPCGDKVGGARLDLSLRGTKFFGA